MDNTLEEAKAILKLRKTEYYQSVQNFFET